MARPAKCIKPLSESWEPPTRCGGNGIALGIWARLADRVNVVACDRFPRGCLGSSPAPLQTQCENGLTQNVSFLQTQNAIVLRFGARRAGRRVPGPARQPPSRPGAWAGPGVHRQICKRVVRISIHRYSPKNVTDSIKNAEIENQTVCYEQKCMPWSSSEGTQEQS